MFLSFLILAVTLYSVVGEVTVVRGVEFKNQAFYDPTQAFTCLDGLKTIPFTSVNDDYCDCADSSDEPGTAACPEGKFFCPNVGFRSKYLQSSRVNDGLCDCCDGSDEYDSDVACFNECDKFGQEDRIKRQQELIEANSGYEKKKEYIKTGKEQKLEKQTKLESINALLEERRVKLEQLRATKEAVEAPEKEAKAKHEKEWEEVKAKIQAEKELREKQEAFTLLDADKNGWIALGEIMSSQFLNEDLTETDAKDILGGEAMVDGDGFTTVWTAIKPKFLKDGRKPVEEPASSEHEGEKESSKEEAVAGKPPVDEPTPADETATEETSTEGMSSEVAEEYRDMQDEIEELRRVRGDSEDEKDDEEDDDEDDDEDDSEDDSEESYTRPQIKDVNMPEYDDATKQLIEDADAARRQFDEVDKEVREFEKQHKEIEEYMKEDFGEHEEFSALKGECYELSDREYTYKLCPFEKVTQRNKNGGSETDLGQWGKWIGQGSDSRYRQMKYENGQGCWNGPARSTTVRLVCGQENSVTWVGEPSRCEYEMEFKTPALCDQVEKLHDEL